VVTEVLAGVAASPAAGVGRDGEPDRLLGDRLPVSPSEVPPDRLLDLLRAGRRRDEDGPLADARPAGPRLVVGMPPMVA
jgi:hypothetical protein